MSMEPLSASNMTQSRRIAITAADNMLLSDGQPLVRAWSMLTNTDQGFSSRIIAKYSRSGSYFFQGISLTYLLLNKDEEETTQEDNPLYLAMRLLLTLNYQKLYNNKSDISRSTLQSIYKLLNNNINQLRLSNNSGYNYIRNIYKLLNSSISINDREYIQQKLQQQLISHAYHGRAALNNNQTQIINNINTIKNEINVREADSNQSSALLHNNIEEKTSTAGNSRPVAEELILRQEPEDRSKADAAFNKPLRQAADEAGHRENIGEPAAADSADTVDMTLLQEEATKKQQADSVNAIESLMVQNGQQAAIEEGQIDLPREARNTGNRLNAYAEALSEPVGDFNTELAYPIRSLDLTLPKSARPWANQDIMQLQHINLRSLQSIIGSLSDSTGMTEKASNAAKASVSSQSYLLKAPVEQNKNEEKQAVSTTADLNIEQRLRTAGQTGQAPANQADLVDHTDISDKDVQTATAIQSEALQLQPAGQQGSPQEAVTISAQDISRQRDGRAAKASAVQDVTGDEEKAGQQAELTAAATTEALSAQLVRADNEEAYKQTADRESADESKEYDRLTDEAAATTEALSAQLVRADNEEAYKQTADRESADESKEYDRLTDEAADYPDISILPVDTVELYNTAELVHKREHTAKEAENLHSSYDSTASDIADKTAIKESHTDNSSSELKARTAEAAGEDSTGSREVSSVSESNITNTESLTTDSYDYYRIGKYIISSSIRSIELLNYNSLLYISELEQIGYSKSTEYGRENIVSRIMSLYPGIADPEEIASSYLLKGINSIVIKRAVRYAAVGNIVLALIRGQQGSNILRLDKELIPESAGYSIYSLLYRNDISLIRKQSAILQEHNIERQLKNELSYLISRDRLHFTGEIYNRLAQALSDNKRELTYVRQGTEHNTDGVLLQELLHSINGSDRAHLLKAVEILNEYPIYRKLKAVINRSEDYGISISAGVFKRVNEFSASIVTNKERLEQRLYLTDIKTRDQLEEFITKLSFSEIRKLYQFINRQKLLLKASKSSGISENLLELDELNVLNISQTEYMSLYNQLEISSADSPLINVTNVKKAGRLIDKAKTELKAAMEELLQKPDKRGTVRELLLDNNHKAAAKAVVEYIRLYKEALRHIVLNAETKEWTEFVETMSKEAGSLRTIHIEQIRQPQLYEQQQSISSKPIYLSFIYNKDGSAKLQLINMKTIIPGLKREAVLADNGIVASTLAGQPESVYESLDGTNTFLDTRLSHKSPQKAEIKEAAVKKIIDEYITTEKVEMNYKYSRVSETINEINRHKKEIKLLKDNIQKQNQLMEELQKKLSTGDNGNKVDMNLIKRDILKQMQLDIKMAKMRKGLD